VLKRKIPRTSKAHLSTQEGGVKKAQDFHQVLKETPKNNLEKGFKQPKKIKGLVLLGRRSHQG